MVEVNYVDVFTRVDIELRKKGLKRDALKGCGASQASISVWAKGERTPNCTVIANIADFLNVTIDWLLFGKERGGELTAEEEELVGAYRQLSVLSKAVVLTAAKGLRP